MVKHLLVDLDGTLLGNRNLGLSVDFATQAVRKFRERLSLRKATSTLLAIYRELGSREDARPRGQTNDRRVIELVAKRLNLPFEEAREFLRDGVSLIFPGLEKHFFPLPGAKEFLDWAKERYTLTLASNPVWGTEIQELRVKWAGLDPKIFSFMTDVRTMHASKPHLEYYLEILEKRGFAADECLLIGNEIKMDLPASRVGIRVFIVEPPRGSKPRPRAIPLRQPEKHASAWRGTYAGLQQLLEEGKL